MKRHGMEFIRRGLTACGFGPMVLAVVYLVLNQYAAVESLTVKQVVTGIFSLTALAFIAGGMNVIYQIERLPLMLSILIHGGVLYVCYLATYLINGWLELGNVPILVFSGIFVAGYFAVWAIIYSVIKGRTKRLNDIISQKHTEAKPNKTD